VCEAVEEFQPCRVTLKLNSQFRRRQLYLYAGISFSPAVWQLQPEVVQTVQQLHVSYEVIWICRTCDYIKLNVLYCVLFSSRVRVRIRVMIRFSVWLVSCYAHCATLGCNCHRPVQLSTRHHIAAAFTFVNRMFICTALRLINAISVVKCRPIGTGRLWPHPCRPGRSHIDTQRLDAPIGASAAVGLRLWSTERKLTTDYCQHVEAAPAERTDRFIYRLDQPREEARCRDEEWTPG